MKSLFDQMVEQHMAVSDEKGRQNALYEVMQQVVLAGLSRGGFFKEAAFYGGTCLRIFHGLKRYSEDMDFSLLRKNPDFKLENYFQAIVDEARVVGRDVSITRKEKKNFGKVESAFLKDNTEVYNLAFQTEKTLKIKIEVDTLPPLEFQTEHKLLVQPASFMTRCFALPDLYAGKMHALVFRQWKNRTKGRDWYDFEWYIRNNIPLDFKHLQVRAKEFNGLDLTAEDFLNLLRERLSSGDIDSVKADVEPFIINKRELDIWSNDYFLMLADRMRFL